MNGKRILCLVIFCASVMVAIEGKRYLLRPIPAAEVRRILKNAGREDAIPEGRVISQGIAAVKGFALGFKKGVIGVAIADGIAALSLISSTTNTTGAEGDAGAEGAGDGAGGGGLADPSANYNSTELCFTSRSAKADIASSGDARQVSTVTGSGGTGGTGGTGGSGAATFSGTNTGSTAATSPTSSTSDLTSPAESNSNINSNTGIGSGSVTKLGSITTTEEDEPTVNCLVIRKQQ